MAKKKVTFEWQAMPVCSQGKIKFDCSVENLTSEESLKLVDLIDQFVCEVNEGKKPVEGYAYSQGDFK